MCTKGSIYNGLPHKIKTEQTVTSNIDNSHEYMLSENRKYSYYLIPNK